MNTHDRITKLTEALDHLQAIDTSVLDKYTRTKHTELGNLINHELQRQRSRQQHAMRAMRARVERKR